MAILPHMKQDSHSTLKNFMHLVLQKSLTSTLSLTYKFLDIIKRFNNNFSIVFTLDHK